MYSQATKDILIARVGWVNPIDSSFTYVLETRNTESNSGRDFQFYHGYVTGKNIVAILPNRNTTELEFNQYLYDLRVQSVLESLYLVIDKDPNYDATFDHDFYINGRIGLFDEVVGLVHALKVLSLLRNSIRSNRIERINAEGLDIEILALQKKLDDAILAATPPFDKEIIVIGTKIW
jgi:hypothetical protein